MDASRLGAFGVLVLALGGVPLAAAADGPRINDQFPTKGHLSPPAIGPVDGCSTHVEVGGFVPKATVKLYRNMALAGTKATVFGFVTFTVPSLMMGDKLSATQTVNGETSAFTNPPTIVGASPSSLGKPTIDHAIYACGRIVPVHGLSSGVTVEVRDVEAASTIGGGFTPNDWGTDWTPAFTSPLAGGHHVTATQAACSPVIGGPSDPVPVLPEPMPLASPSVDPPVLGNDAVTARSLYTGALLEVFDNAMPDGSGYATGSSNWQKLNAPIGAGSMISARQSLCHHGPTSKPQPPVKTLPAPIVRAPICPKDHRALVGGTTIDANVVLFRNGAIVGYGGAGPGEVTLWFAPPNVAATGDKITAIQYIGGIVSPVSNAVTVNCFKQNVVTQHNDSARRGAQLAETALTPANVHGPGFGLLYERAVLGTIMAQPLYVHGVKVGGALKNLVFIATAEDVVYAFDADDTSADTVNASGESTKAIWRTVLGTPHHGDICPETVPAVVGVTSTPVIDVSGGRLYVVARDDKNGKDGIGNDYLHALDITTGTDAVPAVKVGASFGSGDKVQRFQAACQRQRPGLLLLNGNVYLGYGTYSCDSSAGCNGLYRGWVIGYHANDLSPAGSYSDALAPAEGEMGIWASGNGLVGGSDGSIFLQTGNDPNSGGGGPVLANADAFLKLKTSASAIGFAARFQPATAKTLQVGDTDLGAGGPMLLPGGKLIGGGKDGSFFVLPTSDLQTGTTSFQAFYNTFHAGPTPYPYNTPMAWPTQCPPGASVFGVAYEDQPCSVDPSAYINGESFGPNIHGGPVYLQLDAAHGLIYKMPEKDYLKAFSYDVASGAVSPAPAFVATVRPANDGMPGGFSSVSANGMSNGIVWTVVQQLNSMMGPPTPALLYAFDAKNLNVLWHNDADKVPFAKFNAPTIADGRVFLPSFNLFQVYGLAPSGMKKRLLPQDPLAAVAYRWRHTGGPAGMLGRPVSTFVRDDATGGHADFSAALTGGGYAIVSVPVGTKILRPMCDESKRADRPLTVVVSSIYHSSRTGPHYVRGEIRRVFLAQGGIKRFGYPLTDEVAAPDGFGLETRFERATIRWHANKGAVVVQPPGTRGQPPK